MANDNTIARNKKAYHDYEVLEKFEAGIALLGTEVKSCRNRNVQLQDAHAYIEKGEVWLVNAHIALYEQGNRHNHEPKRRRKLLLHKREIRKMKQLTDEKGLTLIPL
ncbi:MAG: SsrA-binding protein SmpB, partial [Lentisphaeria bacterium]|nr:SsrA-binding protein SmpB [Lentisphaeria bacterium]